MRSRLRNPSYFGELLIYTGFLALSIHWLPILFLGAIIIGVWLPNMRPKDKSLSRYPEFAAYASRSKLFIPCIF